MAQPFNVLGSKHVEIFRLSLGTFHAPRNIDRHRSPLRRHWRQVCNSPKFPGQPSGTSRNAMKETSPTKVTKVAPA